MKAAEKQVNRRTEKLHLTFCTYKETSTYKIYHYRLTKNIYFSSYINDHDNEEVDYLELIMAKD